MYCSESGSISGIHFFPPVRGRGESKGKTIPRNIAASLTLQYPIPCFSSILLFLLQLRSSPFTSTSWSSGNVSYINPTALDQPASARNNRSLSVADSCQPRSFQPRLALVNSSVTFLTPSPHNRPFIPITTWSPCGRIHAPLSVRLPCAIIEIPLLHVFIETSSFRSFSRKKSETRRFTNPEASRLIDSDHSEPLPVLPSTSDFRTSLILPECVHPFSFVTLQASALISTLLPPPVRHHRLTCYGTA